MMQKGQAALSVVFLIGGILIVVGVTLMIMYLSFVNSAFGYQLSQQTALTATAGIEDALMQLTRGATVAELSSYQVTVNSAAASMTTAQNANGTISITAVSRISGFTRTIRATVSLHPTTREVSVVGWQFI